MTQEQREILKTLYDAANNDQWNSCRENVAKLLYNIRQSDFERIVKKRMRWLLSNLSATSILSREVVDSITLLDNATTDISRNTQAQLIDTLLKDSAHYPGINNYRTALEKLSTLQHFDNPSRMQIEVMVDVISGLLMAIIVYTWGHQNLELWFRWFYHKTKEDFFILAYHLDPDPKIIELRKSLWIEVATDIEDALQTV